MSRPLSSSRTAELRNRLSRQDMERGHPHIDSELARLKGFDPDEVVVIRKPIASTPIAKFAYTDGRRRIIKAALPMLLCGEMLEIAPLPDFDTAKKTRIRDDQMFESLLGLALSGALSVSSAGQSSLRRLACSSGELNVRVRQGVAAAVVVLENGALADIALSARDARGPVPESPALDDKGTIRVVAAHRAPVAPS